MFDGYFQIDKCSSRKLCQIIATARYLGSMKNEMILSMQELVRRRAEGENFPFETEIDNLVKSLPDFKIDIKSKINIGNNLELDISKK